MVSGGAGRRGVLAGSVAVVAGQVRVALARRARRPVVMVTAFGDVRAARWVPAESPQVRVRSADADKKP
jgi:hypothetical protein